MTISMTAAEYRSRFCKGDVKPGPARRAKHEVGKMNGLESRYRREVLGPRELSGEIIAVEFEGMKLRLADKTFYSPDFLVVTPDCIEVHEVKGHWEDDARVKWKAAAEKFWAFKFFAATRVKGEWQVEEYGRPEAPQASRQPILLEAP